MLDSATFILTFLERELPPAIKHAQIEQLTHGLLTKGALRKALIDHPEYKLRKYKFGKYTVYNKNEFLNWLRQVYLKESDDEQGIGTGTEIC